MGHKRNLVGILRDQTIKDRSCYFFAWNFPITSHFIWSKSKVLTFIHRAPHGMVSMLTSVVICDYSLCSLSYTFLLFLLCRSSTCQPILVSGTMCLLFFPTWDVFSLDVTWIVPLSCAFAPTKPSWDHCTYFKLKLPPLKHSHPLSMSFLFHVIDYCLASFVCFLFYHLLSLKCKFKQA